MFLKILFLSALLVLSGCKLKLLDLVTPETGYRLQEDVEYGELNRQKLDIYTPSKEQMQPLTVVFFYGGAWQNGDKHEYRFVAQAFTQLGYKAIIPDYRVYPGVLFPGFMSDASRAVSWVIDNVEQPLVLMGHSAGAHIAALLALDKQYLGEGHSQIKGFIGLSGPYDFLPLKSERLQTIFAAAKDIDATQPINLVGPQSPPALLIHGLEDKRVNPLNTKNLAAKMKEAGVEVRVELYSEANHGITVGSLAKPLQDHLPVLDNIRDFLKIL